MLQKHDLFLNEYGPQVYGCGTSFNAKGLLHSKGGLASL